MAAIGVLLSIVPLPQSKALALGIAGGSYSLSKLLSFEEGRKNAWVAGIKCSHRSTESAGRRVLSMMHWEKVKQDFRNNALYYVLIPITAIGGASLVAALTSSGQAVLDTALHYAYIVVPLTIVSIAMRCWVVALSQRD